MVREYVIYCELMEWIKRHREISFDMQIGKNFMQAIVLKVDRLEIGACHTDWAMLGGKGFIMR